jgi:hypothetical protein
MNPTHDAPVKDHFASSAYRSILSYAAPFCNCKAGRIATPPAWKTAQPLGSPGESRTVDFGRGAHRLLPR